MDISQAVELYGQLGAAGIISCLFVFMIMNLIRSQKEQSEDLESIKQDISKMQTEINMMVDSIESSKNVFDLIHSTKVIYYSLWVV